MAENRTSYKLKSLSGRRFGVGAESAVSVAAAKGLADAKLKIVSAQATVSGSQSTGIDTAVAGNSAAHSDAAEGLNIEMKNANGLTRNLHIPQVSTSYKSSLNDGSAVITGDIAAVVAAYNTATGESWTIVSARFSPEG